MTTPEAFSTGVAHRIGRYSDAVRVPPSHPANQARVRRSRSIWWLRSRIECPSRG